MKRRSLLLLTVLAIAFCVVEFLGLRIISRRRDELHALRQKAAELNRQLRAVQHQHIAHTMELSAAEEQLAALAAPHDTAPGPESARRAEAARSLERLAQFKQLFLDKPEQAIHEMRLLNDEDWLRVALQIQLGSDEDRRKATASLRTAAKTKFTAAMAAALKHYAAQNQGKLPPTTIALAPYFEIPIDASMLQRYEIAATEGVSDQEKSRTVELRETSPVDADYDTRHHVMANGGWGALFAPEAWVPNFRPRMMAAAKAYAERNHGATPSGLASVLPYFDPPLEPALAEKLLKAQRERRK